MLMVLGFAIYYYSGLGENFSAGSQLVFPYCSGLEKQTNLSNEATLSYCEPSQTQWKRQKYQIISDHPRIKYQTIKVSNYIEPSSSVPSCSPNPPLSDYQGPILSNASVWDKFHHYIYRQINPDFSLLGVISITEGTETFR